jgi:hypothetical protein
MQLLRFCRRLGDAFDLRGNFQISTTTSGMALRQVPKQPGQCLREHACHGRRGPELLLMAPSLAKLLPGPGEMQASCKPVTCLLGRCINTTSCRRHVSDTWNYRCFRGVN